MEKILVDETNFSSGIAVEGQGVGIEKSNGDKNHSNILSIEDLVPEMFSSGGTERIRDIIDRSVGECIGIKRMTYQGLTGYPEKKPTHVYIWYRHFFELQKLLKDMPKSGSKKWIKFVKCHYERDMYQRPRIHKDMFSKDCSSCRNYLENLNEKAIWWFSVEHNFIRMSFKNFWNYDETFECCFMWIRRFGMMEVELEVEESSEGAYIRRSFRVFQQSNTTKATFDENRDVEKKKPSATVTSATHDDHQPFVICTGLWMSELDDLDNSDRMVMTTKFLLQFLANERCLHIVTTYKLVEKGYPVTLFGVTDSADHFYPVGLAITMNAFTEDYEFIFKILKEKLNDLHKYDYKPDVLVSGSNSSIQAAAKKVFDGSILNTCCFFVKSSVNTWLNNAKIDRSDQLEILDDLKLLQLAASNELFVKASESFLTKWNKYEAFVDYFKNEWIINNPNWYAAVTQSKNNSGPESMIMKMSGKYLKKNMLSKYVEDWSKTNAFHF